MGWKGTMRTIVAAARAAERDAQRRNKQHQVAQMFAQSAAAVDDWESHIAEITSIHTNMANRIDWHALADRPRPPEPNEHGFHRGQAERLLADFKPSFFHAFRGGSAKLRSRLEAKVADAANRDRKQYEDALVAHAKAVTEWEEVTALAKQLVRGEAAAIRHVIEEMQSLSDSTLIGTEIGYSIGENFVHAYPKVHGDDIVPSMRRKQLASGRLSETKMPVSQFNELYQDYVTSAALKTAGDLFNILPLNEIYVTCMVNMLNPQTGHKEWTPVLSVQFVRDSFIRLNLADLDPSDSMRNFRHAMKFSKTKGFAAVERLEPVAT